MMSYIQFFNNMLMDFCIKYQSQILYSGVIIIAISPLILMGSRLHESSKNYLIMWLIRNISIIVSYCSLALMIIAPLCMEIKSNKVNTFFWIQVIFGALIMKSAQTMLFEFWEWLPEKPTTQRVASNQQ